MTPTLQLQLLGDFQLVINREPVSGFHQARLHSLLAYLLLHRNIPQTRQQVAFKLWPDSTERQARANLRKALYELHHLVPDLDRFLKVEGQLLQWHEHVSIRLDVTNFEELLAEAKEASTPSRVQDALEAAVALYAGELLPACYDEWVLRQRERLHQRYLNALADLAQLLENRREYASAILYAQQLLQADPLQDASYRALMRLHLQNGDRARALRTYHDCTAVLQQEFGVEPSPETQAAYQWLLEMANVSTPQPPPRDELPLVGRQREWTMLQRAWRFASRGEPRMVLISGEAGIGKTRLAEEVRQWVGQEGYATAKTRCYAAEGQLAYAPVVDWLRAEAIRGHLGRLKPIWLSEVARLLPEILVERPDLPAPLPLSDSWQRQHFREALARAFVTNDQPLLLVLDDLQWCDSETLEWLHYLLRFATQARLLVVGTVRAEEVAADHPLRTLMMNLRQEDMLLEIGLMPLNATETATLAEHVGGQTLDVEQSAVLYAETEGHPLYVVETIRAKAAGVWVDPHPSMGATPLPPKVQDVIHSRLTQLAASTRKLLDVAAVIGRAFTSDLLMQSEGTQGDGEEVAAALDELWQRRILREQASEQANDLYDFSHDKIREAVYGAITPARRRLLHRRVAQALESIHSGELDALCGQVAAHYEQAGSTQQAIIYYQRAAEVARRVFANADAISNLYKGVNLLRLLPESIERTRQELQMQLALISPVIIIRGPSSSELRDVCIRATEIAEQVGNDEERVEALVGLRVSANSRGDVQMAYELSQQALIVAERIGKLPRIEEARAHVAIVLQQLGFFQESYDLLQQLLPGVNHEWSDPIQPLASQQTVLGHQRHFAIGLWHVGYPDRALSVMDKVVAHAHRLAQPYTLAGALCFSAWLHYFRRETEQIEARAAMLPDHSAQVISQYFPAMLRVIEGWAWAQQGEFERGIAHMQEGIEIRHALAQIHYPTFLAMLAGSYGMAGEPTQGVRIVNEALAHAEMSGDHFSDVELYRLKGELLRMQGAGEQEVEGHFLHALAISRQQQAKSLELRAAISLARLWSQQGKRTQARDLLEGVYNWFTEGFDTGDLKDARELLKALAAP